MCTTKKRWCSEGATNRHNFNNDAQKNQRSEVAEVAPPWGQRHSTPLQTHFTSDHELRGNKRHRKNTSLLSDPGDPAPYVMKQITK